MTFELIVSQGRIADRTSGAIPGAALTAKLVSSLTGLAPLEIGQISPARDDHWSLALAEANVTLAELRQAISQTIDRGNRPLMVANTCAASLASLPVAARAHPEAVVLWIDAHGDFNTPFTTESGYLGGMVLAAACGMWESGHGSGIDPKNVIVVGGRDIDPAESDLMKQAGLRIIPPSTATPQAILSEIGDREICIHVDWDVLEPGHIPAAYAIADGLLPDTLREIFSALPTHRILGIELAEFEASGEWSKDEKVLDFIANIVSPLLFESSTT
ncbi:MULTISPECIES: arginase family protein [Rhizobiaceae]|uniref:Arginase/N-omega-hydroxy-L-arginine amidinohydrolase n=1 Tax=Aliirhizobium cellulosilyticum TaxID=393664 RepID=A0A7W6UXA8_9HYPH|nr:arginase family protein [Rhizobium cellulosilyticum]MBB4347197.1 arginase/N-omega-hydroxy-L-arginine amidinohydrolase [Rhizobium cellulosilyticum]MBB4410409.1 arginase/N-omega-hydroxy-L-arginine amidinohydrolase [Rhizobium cellulosilyticum]MBB4445096.1 arginase/N-omega-hydroxy-L-arginine amidinohydrolase [Rhizobium cellulosilyticum]